MGSDEWFKKIAADDVDPEFTAPSKLKARTYSSMIRAQQQAGPLLDLASLKEQGQQLCVFEELVQIAPVGKAAKSMFYCRICHARVLADNMASAPVFWPHCPYVRFQNR
jgi:hypothetical protein